MVDAPKYVAEAVQSFLDNPPDTPFQCGYLDALLMVWTEGLDLADTDTTAAARQLLAEIPKNQN